MPRKPKVLEPEEAETLEIVPEVLPSKKLTPRSLARVQQRILLENAEPMLQEAFTVLRQKLRRGDDRALKMVLEINNMVRAPGGITVTQQVLQQNNNKAEANANAEADAKKFSFESLVRRLDAREVQQSTASDFRELTAYDEE